MFQRPKRLLPCRRRPKRNPRPAKKAAKKAEAPAAEAPKENLSLDPNDVEKPKIIKAKGSKNVHSGFAHVLSTFNNTIVTITDLQRQRDRLVERRQSWLQGLAQEHRLRGADGRAGCLAARRWATD